VGLYYPRHNLRLKIKALRRGGRDPLWVTLCALVKEEPVDGATFCAISPAWPGLSDCSPPMWLAIGGRLMSPMMMRQPTNRRRIEIDLGHDRDCSTEPPGGIMRQVQR
jgi:hypothetical protein